MEETVILQFTGDISLNGLFCNPEYQVALTNNMADLAEALGECHLRIGNFESPLWGDGGVNLKKQPRLCTTEDAAKCLLPLGLDVALLANNHAYDCLEKGHDNTVRFLENNGISHLGAGTDKSEAAEPLILTRKGLKIGLLNYIGPETDPCVPSNVGIHLNMLDENRLFTEISDLTAKADIVVLNLHWGKEFVRYPSPKQRSLARRAVEAGVRVVACHHSHCLQGHERWKKGHIFYSLGNFLFACGKGRETQQWPKLSRQTAVAICVVSKTQVEQAYLTYFCQKGFTLHTDATHSREKKQNRLNRQLKQPTHKYQRIYQREVLLQWLVIAPFRFISLSGGLIKAFRRLRWHHVVDVLKNVSNKTI